MKYVRLINLTHGDPKGWNEKILMGDEEHVAGISCDRGGCTIVVEGKTTDPDKEKPNG